MSIFEEYGAFKTSVFKKNVFLLLKNYGNSN